MTDAVTRKKTAKKRKENKSTVFRLCDLMCEGLEITDAQVGSAPLPLCLIGEKDDPYLTYWNDSIFLYWNFWRCFISALKKRLPEILTKEEIESTKDNMLFSLFFEYESGLHTFTVHREWVARRLGIDQQTEFLAGNSTEAFNKLRSLCLEEGKEKNALTGDLYGLQKLVAMKSSLPVLQRYELNLLLASLAGNCR